MSEAKLPEKPKPSMMIVEREGALPPFCPECKSTQRRYFWRPWKIKGCDHPECSRYWRSREGGDE